MTTTKWKSKKKDQVEGNITKNNLFELIRVSKSTLIGIFNWI